MNDNFERDTIDNDIVSDNTDITDKGENENVDKDVFDSQEGVENNEEVICQEEKADDIQEKTDGEEGEDIEGEEKSASEPLNADNVDITYTRPVTYSATFYSAEVSENENKKPKKSFSGKFVIAVASVCIVLSLVFGAASGMVASYIMNMSNDEGTQKEPSADNVEVLPESTDDSVVIDKNNAPTKVDQVIKDEEEETMTTVEVVDAVSASVVEINAYVMSSNGQYTSGSSGSGVIIAQGEGYAYIVTNYHVVGDTNYITIRLTDKSEYEATYMDGDEDEDIAIIRIEETKELCVAKIGSSDALRVGEGIVVIGNPLGTLGGTVTDGIVSALDREITIDGVTMTLLQTNAAINQGNSGGGLFNMAGRLVGIVNAKYSKNGIEGLGFAIPIDKVYDLLVEIIEEGYIHGRVTIGIDVIYLDRMNALYYFGVRKEGVYIINSDSEELKVGDRIVKIGDSTIASENDYVTAVSSFEIGNEIVIEIDRGGKSYSITVTVIEYVPNSIRISE